MTKPTLAFCIPTHHGRAAFLRESLESILGQLDDVPAGTVTIHVNDNASTDETQAIVSSFSQQYPGIITYRRNAADLGFTWNMLYAVEKGRGDYAWMFSSDDHLAPGGLRSVWEALRDNPGLAGMTLNFEAYNRTMTRAVPVLDTRLYPAQREQPHIYETVESAFCECGSLMGYISGQVVRYDLWQEVVETVSPEGVVAVGYFPYVYVIGEMLRRCPRWMWLPDKVIKNRLDNDSMTRALKQNIIKYQTNVLQGMTGIWAGVLGERSVTFRKLIRDNYATVWHWRALCSYKVASCCTLADEAKALLAFTRRLYFLPGFWVTRFPVLLIPHGVLQAALMLARYLRRQIGASPTKSF